MIDHGNELIKVLEEMSNAYAAMAEAMLIYANRPDPQAWRACQDARSHLHAMVSRAENVMWHLLPVSRSGSKFPARKVRVPFPDPG